MEHDPSWLGWCARLCIDNPTADRSSFQDALKIVAAFEPDKRQEQYEGAAHTITRERLSSGTQINEWLLDQLFSAGASSDWRDYKYTVAGNLHRFAFEMGLLWDASWDPMLRILDRHGYDIDEGGRWTDVVEKRYSKMHRCNLAVERMNAIKAPRLSSQALNAGTDHATAPAAARRF